MIGIIWFGNLYFCFHKTRDEDLVKLIDEDACFPKMSYELRNVKRGLE